MEQDKCFAEVMAQLPGWFSLWSREVPSQLRPHLTELRLFVGQPPLWMEGRVSRRFREEALTEKQMQEIFLSVCQDSVHSFQKELKEGFVTLKGGHRVGLCGTAVYHQGQQSGLREITSLNIRFARQHRNCAQSLFEQMKDRSMEKGSFLLAGPPSSGKTSLLRDYCRILSDKGVICAVLDERGELSGFDLGSCTHVLKAISKEKAILQALRCLSPEVIFCDEIGTVGEAELLCQGLNGGCNFIATIHGNDRQRLLHKPQLQPLFQQDALDALVLLKPLGQVVNILEVRNHADHRLRTDCPVGCAGRLLSQVETGAGTSPLGSPSALFPADLHRAASQSL